VKRLLIPIVLLLAGDALAYNENHRPFPPESRPATIPLVDLPRVEDAEDRTHSIRHGGSYAGSQAN